MFAFWGSAVVRLRWLVLTAAVLFLAFAGIWGTTVFGRMSGDSSLDDPASESQRINDRITAQFGQLRTDLVGLYTSDTLTVTDPQYRAAVQAAATRVTNSRDVSSVLTYYSTKDPSMIAKGGHETFIAVQMVANPHDGTSTAVRHELVAGGLNTQVGGQKAVDIEISDTIPGDIGKAEMFAMPLLLIALLIVFGNFVAAAMPLLIAAFACLGAFTAVRVVSIFTGVSIFSLNIITILGIGLAVDYGLFIVTRYRAELDRGRSVRDAMRHTMSTAGRTVAISGFLVTLALSGLTIFPQTLLRSMGFGGAAAVLFAMLASLTVLPAMLAVLGHRIDAGRLPWGRRRGAAVAAAAPGSGPWAKIASTVVRRPVAYLVGVVVLLGFLALPFLGVHFGGVDERMLPANNQSRIVAERIAADFPNGSTRPIRVLVTGSTPSAAQQFADSIDKIDGVTGVEVAAQKADVTLFGVTYRGDASSVGARGVVTDIRSLTPPSGAQVMVGGTPASVVDQLSSLRSRLPWMALLVAGITFLVLAIGFGSLIVPIKAIVMNLVSISAAFGVVTWIFQDGHLSGWLNFTPTGYVEASQPVLMIAILFGLSMDYEVFLLSRIREHWDAHGDNTAAIVTGVQRTGRMISTAAVLLCIVVGFFSMSSITFIKMIGVGMVVAILVDATLVRLLLVPVTMRLLGRYNWWAPSWLQRMYGRYGLAESDTVDVQPAPVTRVVGRQMVDASSAG